MVRDADRTFGKSMLMNIANMQHETLTDEQNLSLINGANIFIRRYKNNDTLVKLLCTYHEDKGFQYDDIVWFSHILKMIEDGRLYMNLVPLSNWASPDLEFEENKKNIRDIGLDVKKIKGNSDGVWQYKEEMTFGKVYPSCHETPENIEEITVENPFGIVEFGFQSICKTAMSLIMGDCLLRVPYNSGIRLPFPVCAFFIRI